MLSGMAGRSSMGPRPEGVSPSDLDGEIADREGRLRKLPKKLQPKPEKPKIPGLE
jgi:hypothetical protein